jgi:hypothetical protein
MRLGLSRSPHGKMAMADYVSFNEFIKVDYYRDTMARALSRPFRESAAFLDSVDAPVISDDTIEAQTSGSRLAPVVKVDHDGMSW